MKVLSFYVIDSSTRLIGAFLDTFYAGDNIHHVTIQGIDEWDHWPKEILFTNYDEAHKFAFVQTFGEEVYKQHWGD